MVLLTQLSRAAALVCEHRLNLPPLRHDAAEETANCSNPLARGQYHLFIVVGSHHPLVALAD